MYIELIYLICIKETDAGMKEIPAHFLTLGIAKRFDMQMGAWSGKQSMYGKKSPFENGLSLLPSHHRLGV